MLNAIETYLALRRATGFAMSNAEYLLKSFAAFAMRMPSTGTRTSDFKDVGRRFPTEVQRVRVGDAVLPHQDGGDLALRRGGRVG